MEASISTYNVAGEGDTSIQFITNGERDSRRGKGPAEGLFYTELGEVREAPYSQMGPPEQGGGAVHENICRKSFPGRGTASAKALGWKCTWVFKASVAALQGLIRRAEGNIRRQVMTSHCVDAQKRDSDSS